MMSFHLPAHLTSPFLTVRANAIKIRIRNSFIAFVFANKEYAFVELVPNIEQSEKKISYIICRL